MKSKIISVFSFMICAILMSCSSTQKILDKENDNKFDKYEFYEITYDIKDNNTLQLLENHKNETKFKKGKSFKISTFNKEKNRIAALIRKHQNRNFSGDSIRFEIDTTLIRNKFSVVTSIRN